MSSRSQKPANPRDNSDQSGAAAPETVSGLIVSLLFWISLLVATGLFAIVGLSPKLLEQARLRGQFQINQLQLVQVERQNEQLQRVVDAIRHDREFAAEMTRVEFDAVRSDEEIIPVDSDLRLVPRDLALPRLRAEVPQAWYRPWIVPFVENDSLRMSALGAAATLVIVSFTWLQPATRRQPIRSEVSGQSLWQIVRARYVRAT